MSAKPLRVLPKKQESTRFIDVPVVGWVCGYDPERGLLVDFPNSAAQGPIAARWTLPLDKATVEQAVREQQKAVLIFEEGDPQRPIVTGLLQPLSLPEAKIQLPGKPTEVRVDGDTKRLAFEAADEIVLRCGKASLTLRNNGAVSLKGAYVLSHSSGVNRIRGGSVQIN